MPNLLDTVLPPKWSIILCGFVLIAGGCLMAFALLWSIPHEIEFRDGIREERCARYGEQLPSGMEAYCANLGV